MLHQFTSQGAKPAHGGMLPKEKITEAIAEARGLGAGPYEDCNSPPRHSAFTNFKTPRRRCGRCMKIAGC